MEKAPRILLLHYVLIGYVTLQFIWWAWLIYDLNVDILNLEAELSGSPVSGEELRGKLWMILGEGSVFFLLLGVGAWFIRKFVLREHKLARQERNFLLATTHEFNSPIAAVKLNLQTLKRKQLSTEQHDSVVEGALQATTRLQSLVGNVLMASRIDAGKYQLHSEEVDINALVNRLHNSLKPLLLESGNTLLVDSEVSDDCLIDASSVEFIISNLIVNASKYAPKSEVRIVLRNSGKFLQVEVLDQGSGIDPAEYDHIFKKFYRVGSEETRTKKGTGLGLFLVKELLMLQGGDIRVSSGPNNRGTSFKFQIPHGKS